MPCPRTQQANLSACSPQPPLNTERQAGKLRMPFFKVFWYDSTRGNEPLVYRMRSGRSNHYTIASVSAVVSWVLSIFRKGSARLIICLKVKNCWRNFLVYHKGHTFFCFNRSFLYCLRSEIVVFCLINQKFSRIEFNHYKISLKLFEKSIKKSALQ